MLVIISLAIMPNAYCEAEHNPEHNETCKKAYLSYFYDEYPLLFISFIIDISLYLLQIAHCAYCNYYINANNQIKQ